MRKDDKMGLLSIILLGINGMIGSGIFLLPGEVSSIVGNASLFVYIFVCLIVLAIAWCFAHCSSIFSRSGGAYLYAKEAFGHFIGFEIGLMRWVAGITSWACLIVGFIKALSVLSPKILKEPCSSLLIASIIGGLGVLNIMGGVRVLKYLNNIMTIAKVSPLIFLVVIGIFYIDPSHFVALPSFEWEAKTLGSSALIIFYAFGGFEGLVVAAGEMDNPQKNLPIAVMAVIGFCSFLYIVVQMISIGILGSALNGSSAPIADAAYMIYGTTGQYAIMIAMLFSIGGVNFSASFITPRSGVALAEDGMIPSWIARKGKYDTPVWAILLTMLMTAIVALSGNFTQLVAINVVARFAQYIITCLALMVFYKRGQLSPFSRKPIVYMGTPLFALSGIFLLLVHATILQILWGFGGLILGVPLYFFWVKPKQKEEDCQQVVALEG